MPGLLAAALLTAVAALYLAVILDEPEPNDWWTVGLFAGAILTAAMLAAAGSLAREPHRRRLLFGIAGAIAFVCGWLSGFSIGMLFLPPVLLLAWSFGRG